VKALLDTQAFLWWDLDDRRLSAAVKEIVQDPGSEIYVSAASAWEIAIKVGLRRLELPAPVDSYVSARLTDYRFKPLAIGIDHALRVATLPLLHGDPFDRLLIAQSQLEELPIITLDPLIARYDVETIW
jgi:PIN domain nuclease of toxin-antitoxin system